MCNVRACDAAPRRMRLGLGKSQAAGVLLEIVGDRCLDGEREWRVEMWPRIIR
jgi:hypothetical protein